MDAARESYPRKPKVSNGKGIEESRGYQVGAEYIHSTVCTCMKYSYVIHYYVQWIYVTKYFIHNISNIYITFAQSHPPE